VVWLTVISVLVLGEVLELLSAFIVNWQVVHPEEGLLLGVVSVPCHEDVIICLSWDPV
jgi:ABC-type transport system involved in cytochrome c biogenesis permease component